MFRVLPCGCHTFLVRAAYDKPVPWEEELGANDMNSDKARRLLEEARRDDPDCPLGFVRRRIPAEWQEQHTVLCKDVKIGG